MNLSSEKVFHLGADTSDTMASSSGDTSDTKAALIGVSIFLVVGGFLALGFYQAYKGIRPVYAGGYGHDHHHEPGVTFQF